MLCVQEIYETYKKDIDKWRELLYKQTKSIIRQVLKTKGMYVYDNNMDDLISTVFLKLDEKIIKWKWNILLWTFSTIQEFIAQNTLLFLKIPRKRLGEWYSYIRLDHGDLDDEIIPNQIKKKTFSIDFIKKFMNKNLTIDENIVINTKYFDYKNNRTNIEKQLQRRLKKTKEELKEIEKKALNKIKNILDI